jgi:hypothetical protein
MSQNTQSFKNHAKFVPLFHFFAFPLAALSALWWTAGAIKHPSGDAVVMALMGWSLAATTFLARIFALTVQDRVIRLEMRLRLRELLPPDLQPRIGEFTRHQLVAMRFASDRELPAIARKVLDERLEDRKAIKLMVQEWEADHLRA